MEKTKLNPHFWFSIYIVEQDGGRWLSPTTRAKLVHANVVKP
jgi:hypothetical protein